MANHDPALDRLFQALADPTRRAVLERLTQGPATVGELAAPFAMALPSLIGHLRKLEAAGLIETRKDGRVRTCAVRPEALTPVQGWLDVQRAQWEARLDRLDSYVAKLMKERANGA
ncbi:MAG: helix-turn-helix transcriptional regulator [Rhodobacter sp.]|uniref:ArsR/SmtB family transcription factor n=1 Tax=Pararhodobacter sp. TaxID=2127056 RepID=UPI001DE77371|nr:metalloregulator ArsR/SmtB family transcription factor [Pararhodobacter sp.]MCB1346379.1 helix-turn-helix transcriptional regulator [Paracoccaceae bacterium]MCC0072983.1 helix-turn-helix transcriptional regulator [Rhodobacter sp.]HPD93761.1 metalloregulator ArsR/SmtB family transcription factor [Pararhodobacter sp.]